MAIYSYTDSSGVKFNNLNSSPSPIKKVTGKVFNTNNDYEFANEGGIQQLTLDSILIDWNGAQVAGKTLNTTGEMLSILQTAYNYATTYSGTVKKVNNVAPDANGNVTISVGSTLSGATTTTLGGIKTKYHTTGNATIVDTSSSSVTNRNYGIETDGAYLAFVKVPWTDTDTKVTSAANHYTPATDSSSALSATAKDGTAAWGTQVVKGVTVSRDAKGHITGISVQSAAIPAQPTSVTGNAGSATKLATARTLTIGAKGKTFDGSANVAWTLSEIGAAAASHTHDDYTTKSFVSDNYAAKGHTHDNYITTTAANNNYAAKNHTHADLAPADHTHTDLATKNHASTSNAYGVGTYANYGHLKISGDYAISNTYIDVALSLGGAYNLYKHFMTTIASMQQTINGLSTALNNLSTRVDELHATKNYTLTVTLSNCTSPTLKTGTISENGGTYTVTAATHYNLPSTITVKQGSTTLTAGTHYTWSNGSLRILPGITDNITVTINATAKSYTVTVTGNATSTTSSVQYTTGEVSVTLAPKSGYTVTGATVTGATYVSFSNNVVKFKSMTGNVTITAQTSEIVLTGVTVSESGSGSGSISGDAVSLTGKGSSITLLLNSTPDNALNKTMTLTATDSANAATTKLGLNTSSATDGGTVKLTPTGTLSNAKLKISNNKGTLLKTLTVNVADGSTTAVSVKNSANGTSSSFDANGGNVTLTATVTSTRFATQTVNWSKSGGTLSATTGNSVTFTAPANTSESAAATYTITATCDGKTATYTVTVAKKAASTKYYWYAGWTIPTAENIATIVNETYPASKTSTTMNPAGKTATSTDGVIMDYNAANIYNKAANVQYYVVVPNGQGIYDSLGTKLHLDDAAFTIYSSTAIANHTIYVSSSTSRIIDVIIKK